MTPRPHRDLFLRQLRLVRFVTILLAWVLVLSGPSAEPPTVWAQSAKPSIFKNFEDAMQDMAQEIKRFLMSRPDAGSAVRVTAFEAATGPSGGANVVRVLTAQLQAQGVTISDSAAYKISGDVISDRDGSQLVTLIQGKVANSRNVEQLALRRRIVQDASTAIAFLATTADLSRAANDSSPNQSASSATTKPTTEVAVSTREATTQLLASVEQPQAVVVKATSEKNSADGNPPPARPQENAVLDFLQVSEQSPYGIAVLKAGPDGQLEPCEIRLEPVGMNGKQAFVSLERNDLFQVQIRNTSESRVGCQLLLDGIHIFAFSDVSAWRNSGRMVIAPGGGLIAGWHQSGDTSRAFKITAYGESAAKSLGANEGSLGTITAIFYELHSQPTMGATPHDAVGFGGKVRSAYKTASTFVGNPVGTVTIRYRRPAPPTDLPPGE